MTVFAKHSISDVWQSSEYVSGLLKLFCHSSKRDTQEYLLYIKLIIVFTQNFSLILKSHSTWKYNIQAKESITKIKEKPSIIQFIQFDAFVFYFAFFHFSVPNNKCHRQKWHVLLFTHIKLAVCLPDIAHIKRRRLDLWASHL